MNSNKIYDLSEIPGLTKPPEQLLSIQTMHFNAFTRKRSLKMEKHIQLQHVLMLTYKLSDFLFRKIKKKEISKVEYMKEREKYRHHILMSISEQMRQKKQS